MRYLWHEQVFTRVNPLPKSHAPISAPTSCWDAKRPVCRKYCHASVCMYDTVRRQRHESMHLPPSPRTSVLGCESDRMTSGRLIQPIFIRRNSRINLRSIGLGWRNTHDSKSCILRHRPAPCTSKRYLGLTYFGRGKAGSTYLHLTSTCITSAATSRWFLHSMWDSELQTGPARPRWIPTLTCLWRGHEAAPAPRPRPCTVLGASNEGGRHRFGSSLGLSR